jgi:hypothetical protein
MRNQVRLIPVALACALGALALHRYGGLNWAVVVPVAILFSVGAALILRSSAPKLD